MRTLSYVVAVTLVAGLCGAAPADWHFDVNYDGYLGDSPTAAGYTHVGRTDVYTVPQGWGWVSSPETCRDRGTGAVPGGTSQLDSDLGRDFIFDSAGAADFKLDLDNGKYDVTYYVADWGGPTTWTRNDNMLVAEGSTIIADLDFAAGGPMASATGRVTVTDGQLNLTFGTHDAGGSLITDGYAHVNAFDVVWVPEPATVGLLSLGFAGIAVLRRRRRAAIKG